MNYIFDGKSILVTGACGTVGSELIRQLLTEPNYKPAQVVGIDSNESELFFLDQRYLSDDRANFFVADIRERDDLIQKMQGIDIVFHCAALKHVILNERSPEQAVLTNILGVQNVIAAAQACNVEKVIFTSSDKAVNPTNVMGTSKLMGERLMTAANSSKRVGGPVFASTRFGNVLGSNGSVFSIFHNQIAKGGPLTLTDLNMSRFVMSVSESVSLLVESAMRAMGGEVFVTKMPVVRIEDLARAMIKELAPLYGHTADAIEIIEIGAKPGEKLYEELMSEEETRRSLELRNYFVVLPAFKNVYSEIDYHYPDLINCNVTKPYVSSEEVPCAVDQIRELLNNYGLLDMHGDSNKASNRKGI